MPRGGTGICPHFHTFRGSAILGLRRRRSAVKNKIKPRAAKPAAGTEMLSFCNNASLRKAARRLGKLYDAVLEPTGLKATQFSLLTQTYDLGNPTMAELAKSLLM